MNLRSVLIAATAAVLAMAFALPVSAGSSKLNPSLRFLKHEREAGRARGKNARPELAAARTDLVDVTVRFDHVLSPSEIAELEKNGFVFVRLDGSPARSGTIYPVAAPWSSLEAIAASPSVLRMESSWRPAVFPLLDVSAREIEADSAWTYDDPLDLPLTGKGMRIADFDTGIDVFHPSFFLADGDTLDWIDVDGFGQFEPGSDCVDLNKNGIPETNERLSYFEGWIYDPARVWGSGTTNNVGTGYQTYWDWLYNDANGNGTRNYGTAFGYTEGTPTYGERMFIVIDADGDGALDPGEKLVALGTSKIYATKGDAGIERVRGVNLIQSTPDANGHGTAVSGILAGGTVGRHRFTGIAPDAEILMGYYFSGNAISALIPWARSLGADVVLYEFGGFVFEYLDGTSLDEILIAQENDSIIQITPSGNLGRGHKHALATLAGRDSLALRITVPIPGTSILTMWNTTLWRAMEGDLTFRLKSPRGGTLTLSGSGGYLDGFYVWCEKSSSPSGTCAMNVYVSNESNPALTGTWELKIVNNKTYAIEFMSNVADDVTSWGGGAEWLDYYSDQKNVTWPATAEAAFVNGSYSTRGFEGYNGVGGGTVPPGQISVFSGRGTRIDGKHLLDIVSPGNYDVYSTKSTQDGSGYPLGSYRQFSGTSAAGPHVAAAAALVQQAFPQATMQDVATLITTHAATDAFTGAVYNDTWGWGKLRILGAIGAPTGVDDIARGASPPRVALDQNYPNPFNPSTWIPFYLPADGLATVSIYNVRGDLVKVLGNRWMTRGAHSVRWSGDDSAGRRAASGVYFCVLRAAGETHTRKLVLLR